MYVSASASLCNGRLQTITDLLPEGLAEEERTKPVAGSSFTTENGAGDNETETMKATEKTVWTHV